MRKSSLYINWSLLAPVVVLVTFSLTTLFSIDLSLFKSQLTYFIIGIFVFLFFSQTNYSVIKYYFMPIYVISVVLLCLVLLLGIESRGSVRWLELFGFRVQFSEILKPFLAISLSSYLAAANSYSLRVLLLSVCFLIPIVFLVFLQPDLGNASIYFFVAILTFIIYGFPKRYFVAAFGIIIAISPFLWNFLHDYQKNRIFTFLNPNDPLGQSYNAIQSVIAVGSGNLLGRGLGLGTQSGLRFLPERHTDFIFATLAEELGLVGTTFVILTFVFLLFRIRKIFLTSDDLFVKIFSISAFSLMFVQLFVNVGMNIGIVPIVGITLPFVSYGGSSLLSSFILLGILASMSRDTASKTVLEIK